MGTPMIAPRRKEKKKVCENYAKHKHTKQTSGVS
jgi:hypothetical protein